MLVATQRIKDLGRVKFGQPYNFDYLLTNRGFKEVEIKKLQVSCSSCTVASTNKKILKPGENTTINVKFTPGTISRHRKYISVIYNDGEVLKLEFNAESHE